MAVVGAVSANDGLICFDVKERSINSNDFCNFLRRLRGRTPGRLTILLDNASIHKTRRVKELCRELKIDIIYNVPYCPQFNGIEHVWAMAKAKYKTMVAQMFVS